MQIENYNRDLISLQQLEFPKIVEKLRSLLSTPFGEEKLKGIEFSDDRKIVQRRLDEVMELFGQLDAGNIVPLGGFSDIRRHLDRIKPEAAYLEAEALMEVKSNLQRMMEVAHFFRERKGETPTLQTYAGGIHSHREIIKEIDNKIDRSGEIHDNASSELRKIRIKIRSIEADQAKTLRRVQQRYADYSQDEIVTLRDGRMVLGILPNHINKVNGIVHGTSGSGATVFVEPMETLQLSNQVQNLKIQERTEIIKILKSLTALIRDVRDDIYYGIENVSILDVILAKARLSSELDANMPKLADEPRLKIKNGKHPLLILKMGPESAVPLTLELGRDFRTLVITGPNAGGKTVCMKTVGLLVLMTQIGLLIPAAPDSEIPLLSDILVDIGDRQSLEQDLSTFSAHVVRLKEILEKSAQNRLVLLDEVGTGTDPKEGSALAIAMLTQLTEKQALTIATTHHGELKAFAHQQAQVENGSMEFDLETLLPTYRLRIGIPGSSYAIEIARRYGLPESLVQQAKDYVGEDKDRLEDLILNLEDRIQKIEKERGELSLKLSKAEMSQNLYERQLKDLKENKSSLKEKAAAEAEQILKNANAIIERAVQEIRHSDASKTAIKTAKESVKTKRSEVEKMLRKPATAKPPSEKLEKGARVWIDSLNEEGELLEDLAGKRKVRVQVGNVTMTLDTVGIRKSNRTSEKPKSPRPASAPVVDSLSRGAKPELDLRGLDSQDAIEETDRYLDDALESGWEEVRIVHGKGTGVLRKRVNEFLSRDKRVEEKRLGKWGEGDTGVTVVKLRH